LHRRLFFDQYWTISVSKDIKTSRLLNLAGEKLDLDKLLEAKLKGLWESAEGLAKQFFGDKYEDFKKWLANEGTNGRDRSSRRRHRCGSNFPISNRNVPSRISIVMLERGKCGCSSSRLAPIAIPRVRKNKARAIVNSRRFIGLFRLSEKEQSSKV
jgi:hypothetical protein